MSLNKINLKSSDKFNIYVVEDHNNALNKIYKDIGSKRLNLNNLTMIHFDSHPDLGIPNDLNADLVINKDTLLNRLSIENWILPAVYAGHLKTIIWIRPPWATQINTGRYNLIIGKHLTTNLIRINCKESYFLADNLYSNESNLINKREFILYVCDFDFILNENDEFITSIFDTLNENHKELILDIDLDFFSTQDPFRLMFKTEDEFELFKKIYHIKSDFLNDSGDKFDESYSAFSIKKKEKLNLIFDCLNKGSDFILSNNEFESNLKELSKIILENKIDLEILHEYGSGMDDSPLPHNVSTNEEIRLMISKFKEFLQKYFQNGQKRPTIVTIARSSLDDYCPPDQVDYIQQETIESLRSYFNNSFIRNIDMSYEKLE